MSYIWHLFKNHFSISSSLDCNSNLCHPIYGHPSFLWVPMPVSICMYIFVATVLQCSLSPCTKVIPRILHSQREALKGFLSVKNNTVLLSATSIFLLSSASLYVPKWPKSNNAFDTVRRSRKAFHNHTMPISFTSFPTITVGIVLSLHQNIIIMWMKGRILNKDNTTDGKAKTIISYWFYSVTWPHSHVCYSNVNNFILWIIVHVLCVLYKLKHKHCNVYTKIKRKPSK